MKYIFTFFIFHFSFFISATAQSQKVVADKIIAVIGNKIILKSEIENTIADMKRQEIDVPENAICLTLEQAMGVKALVLQGEKDSIPVSDEEVSADIDNQIRYFIQVYGSKEELEKISGKSIYQLKEDFKEGFRDRKMAAAMRNKIVDGIRITPNEVKAYFDQLPKDSLAFYESELEIGQVVIYPKPGRDAEEYAIDQLKEFKSQIESGKKDFCKLASIYSDDPGSKENCGKYEVNRGEKQWDPVFLAKAFTLKEGQISAPFKTRFGYHIIQMVSRSGDDAVIRHILKAPQITTAEIKAINQKLDSVRGLLVSGKIQFGEAVSKFSDDESSKFTGGMKQGSSGGTSLTIDELDKDILPLIKNLTPGQYSQPTEFTDERGKRGVRIVYLVSKSEPHRENIKDDYNKIAQRALEEKKNEALDKWFSQKISGYYIRIDDEYKSCPEMAKWIQPEASAAAKN
ncbi:peptidylprolyl isomerase [Ferruginibacter sp. SUN002]|uniref:peptidylprolyl isomerase n=1 Tax=Ferruginibacter sp. SUN002 TaxID=2937789 RepID=UPI003D36475E